MSCAFSINKSFWLVSDKTSPTLKRKTVMKCCWQSGLQQSTHCLRCCGGSNSKEFGSFINTSRVLHLCINVKWVFWKHGVWKVIDAAVFFPFFSPAVVFSTPVSYKEKFWAGISGVFLCLQLVSSELVEIFSPSLSVLAHSPAKGVTVFC